MMASLLLMVKGFFIGIAFIIPGLSGGTLAIYLGVYEKMLHAIGHIFKEMKESLIFLIPLFLGIGLSIVSLARLLGVLIDMNSLIIMMFFIGIILGGIKDLYNRATKESKEITPSSIMAFMIAFSVVLVLVIFGTLGNASGNGYFEINLLTILLIFILGMAASMTMIVPGVSGSALLITLGFYTAIVTNVIGNVFDFEAFVYNVQVIIPFGLGAALGIILFSALIEKALKYYNKETYFAILGFIMGSIIAIIFEIKDPSSADTHDLQTSIFENFSSFIAGNLLSLIIGILLLGTGFILSKKLTELNKEEV
jgi:putative membrane protein